MISVTPQKALEVIQRLMPNQQTRQIELAIALLSGKAQVASLSQANDGIDTSSKMMSNEQQKAEVIVMKKQISLSSLIAQKCTSFPLKDCLTYGILHRLIDESKWQCIFLMRLLLLFLKQAQKVAPQSEDTTQLGIDIVDQILSKRPWLSKDEAFWPNLMRGLCFFAAEYSTKSPQVREIFRKHLLSGDKNEEQDTVIAEFSQESPLLKDILTSTTTTSAKEPPTVPEKNGDEEAKQSSTPNEGQNEAAGEDAVKATTEAGD